MDGNYALINTSAHIDGAQLWGADGPTIGHLSKASPARDATPSNTQPAAPFLHSNSTSAAAHSSKCGCTVTLLLRLRGLHSKILPMTSPPALGKPLTDYSATARGHPNSSRPLFRPLPAFYRPTSPPALCDRPQPSPRAPARKWRGIFLAAAPRLPTTRPHYPRQTPGYNKSWSGQKDLSHHHALDPQPAPLRSTTSGSNSRC